MSIEKLSVVWNKIAIDISYNNDWSKGYREIQGHAMAHLEIESQNKERLPITDTGYRSHFIAATEIEKYGGAEKYVCAWLDDGAQSKEWKDYVEQSKQLSLF